MENNFSHVDVWPQEARGPDIAVIIPCYNEAPAIGKVIRDFRRYLPDATIYVYDNNSTDGTAEAARAAGAIVRVETRQGKGYVVRRMFADVEADIFVLIDGDDTYDASAAPGMVRKLISDHLDLVNGVRTDSAISAYRPGHKLGNQMLSGMVRTIFGRGISDMLSGYRVFSRRFVKSFPVMSRGFEIETEMTIHALELEMPVADMPSAFKDRAEGTASKLNSIRDGLRIFGTIVKLLKQERPTLFFGVASGGLALLSLFLAVPIFLEYFDTGLVPRFPTAILSTGLMILAFLSLAIGLVLETVTRGRQESKRMQYLLLSGTYARADSSVPGGSRTTRTE